jgi:hypothetical protein
MLEPESSKKNKKLSKSSKQLHNSRSVNNYEMQTETNIDLLSRDDSI